PRDRPLQAVVELYARLEADLVAGLLDVRDAQLDVHVLERREHDLAGTAGDALDALREVEDRHGRARVADVEALADGTRMLEAETHGLDHVVDVAPRADLRAVAANGQVVARERGLDERANRAAADLSGTVDVERAHGHDRQAQLVVVRVRHVLAGKLRDRVRPARLSHRADRRDLTLAHVVGVRAEDLARR